MAILLSNTGLETNARPRRVKFRPGEWFVRPDQPGGRVGILRGFIDHIVIASLSLISSGLSPQKIASGYFSKLRYKIVCNDIGFTVGVRGRSVGRRRSKNGAARQSVAKSRNGSTSAYL